MVHPLSQLLRLNHRRMFAETEDPPARSFSCHDEAALRPIFKLLAGMRFSPAQHLPALGDSGFQGDG